MGVGIWQINDGGIRLLNWTVGKGLRLMNSCFQKRKRRLITIILGETKTMIGAKDMKVISCEEIVSQHRLSVDGYGVQKEGQEESKILKEIGTVEIKRVRGERRVC